MRFYEERFAREYDRRLQGELYPGSLLDAVLDEIRGSDSLIDCGAGSGFFTVPMARMGFQVQAVEPSPAMTAIMREKIEKENRDLPVIIYEKKWEEWTGEHADALICIHAIYGMNEPENAIGKMLAEADKRILVAGDKGRPSVTVAKHIRKKIPASSASSRRDIDPGIILESMERKYEVRQFQQTRISRFQDIYQEAEYYCYSLKLDVSCRDDVMDVLRDISSVDSEGYWIPLYYYDQIYIF